MPIIKSAIKRAKQTAKRHSKNLVVKKDLKLSIKEFLAKPSATSLSEVQKNLDKSVKKNILKKNTASRKKARLSRIAKEAGVTFSTKKATAAKKPAAKKAPAKKPAAKKAPAKKTTAKKTEDKK